MQQVGPAFNGEIPMGMVGGAVYVPSYPSLMSSSLLLPCVITTPRFSMEHQGTLADFHATVVAPRKHSLQDMSGGFMPDNKDKPDGVIETVALSVESERSREEDEPTEEEVAKLRHISDKIPWSAFLVAVIELCERFTYYGLSGPFQNYITNAYPSTDGLPGALGMGQQAGTGLTDFFQFCKPQLSFKSFLEEC